MEQTKEEYFAQTTFPIENNFEDLKALIDQADKQAKELKRTLKKIDKFKVKINVGQKEYE
ncbi:hypothetical protein JQ662_000235 [Listeria monocytogenes]|nr:hypothetical protein [Listeria monocytogenes]